MAQGTFHIITFGCQMNVNDSFWLARSLQRRGFVESPLEKAEVVILNTCSVRDKPEQKVYAALGRIKYETRRVPGSFAVVAGCVAQQIGAGFFERFPQVRLVVGGDGLAMAPDAIERLHGDPSLRLNLTDFSEIYPERDPALPAQGEGEIPPVAFVNIMQGCDNFCTYCIVPFTRGRQKSRDAGAILDECRALIDNGAKEITLLGQNVNSYGLDKHASGDTSFARLLRKVSELPGLARLRFVTPHPKDLSPEVIAMFGEVPNLCPRLHLPLQAGSDRVLARMNRKYDMARYMTLVEGLRAARPGVDVENGPEFVLVAAQHVAHFEFFDLFERRGVVGVHLLLADHALLHEVGHQLKVLGILANGVVILDPCLDPRHLAQLLARLVGVVPEVRLLGFLLFVAQVDALLVDVQTAFQRFPALFDLLDLFRKYHNMLKISCSVSVRRTPG